MRLVYRGLRYVISPPFCAYCKVFLSKETPLCAACLGLIKPVVSTAIPVTKKYSITVFAIANYNYPLKSLILAKSYSNIVASVQLGTLMWDMTAVQYLAFDYIVPIPLHWTRLSWRGYNQAHEISQVLAQKSGKPILNIVCRTKRTPFQSSMPVAQRPGNVHKAFFIDEQYRGMIEGKHILLVDDLLTTGSTLKAAARELIRYKPARISAIVACRVV